MKVVINAASAKTGGAVTYITNVLRCLPAPESGYEFEVLLPPETAAKQEQLPENVRFVRTAIGHAAWWKRIWWEQVTLRRWLKRQKADVLFSTANFGMFRCPVRQLLLVRNAHYFSKIYQAELLARHSLRFQARFGLRRWLICRSVRHADVVMTPTQAMLDDLRRFVEVDPQKALVNPYGVAPADSSLPGAQSMATESPQADQRGRPSDLRFALLRAQELVHAAKSDAAPQPEWHGQLPAENNRGPRMGRSQVDGHLQGRPGTGAPAGCGPVG